MIKAIIFDWGNVIKFYDNEKFKKVICKKYKIDEKLFKKVELKHRLRNDLGEIDVYEYIENVCNELDIKKDYYSKLWFSSKFSKMNKQLIKIIEKLREKYKIFLLSNNNEHTKDSVKSLHKIDHLFDRILFSYEVRIKKPDPMIFKELLKGTSLKTSECLMVDDRADVVEQAKKLGMKGIVFKDNKDLIKEMKNLKIKY